MSPVCSELQFTHYTQGLATCIIRTSSMSRALAVACTNCTTMAQWLGLSSLPFTFSMLHHSQNYVYEKRIIVQLILVYQIKIPVPMFWQCHAVVAVQRPTPGGDVWQWTLSLDWGHAVELSPKSDPLSKRWWGQASQHAIPLSSLLALINREYTWHTTLGLFLYTHMYMYINGCFGALK